MWGHCPQCFADTLGRSVFGSLSTFSIAVRVSKPPTTLKGEGHVIQLSQHTQNLPTPLPLIHFIYAHYSSRILNHHIWDLNLKLNRAWKNPIHRGKAKPKTWKPHKAARGRTSLFFFFVFKLRPKRFIRKRMVTTAAQESSGRAVCTNTNDTESTGFLQKNIMSSWGLWEGSRASSQPQGKARTLLKAVLTWEGLRSLASHFSSQHI